MATTTSARGLAIFTKNTSDLYQKLIALQKRDGHTYIHTTLAAHPWPTIRDPMPHANALGNNYY